MPTTGIAELNDVGALAYNGCTFSCLFASKLTGKQMPDRANRTITCTEWTLAVTGYVTLQLQDGTNDTIDGNMEAMRQALSEQGGQLTYTGRGFGYAIVNPAGGGGIRDIAWGPVPTVFDFTPLGQGNSALVTWSVVFRVPEQLGGSAVPAGRVVQFNEEITISYDSEGYSTLSISGTLEIALTRTSVNTRTLTSTVDDYRQTWITSIISSIDLTRFYIPDREFKISRDRRTMEWSLTAKEQAPMGNPVFIPSAKGKFTCRSDNRGMAIWTCSLSATYTVRKDQPRRVAWFAFLSLLKFRMESSVFGTSGPAPPPATPLSNLALSAVSPLLLLLRQALQAQQQAPPGGAATTNKKAWLMSFSFDEGLYEDSKSMSFTAHWKLLTTIEGILRATGIWRWPGGTLGGNLWAAKVQDIAGWKGNLDNSVLASGDAIVDLGG